MKKILKRTLLINQYFFYCIYTLTFSIVVIESFKYRGFFKKHLFLDSNVLLVLTIILGILTIFSRKPENQFFNNLRNYFYNGQLFIIPFISLFWLALLLLNAINYPNYVFTKFHIIPDNLIYPLELSFFITVLYRLTSGLSIKSAFFLSFSKSIKVLIIAFFFSIFSYQNVRTLSFIFGEMRLIIVDPTASYDKKMSYKWGDNIYSYVLFIKQHTPPTAIILIPPRSSPWPVEGNDHLMRGFLYPRRIISYNKKVDLSKEKIHYVLISWGLWRTAGDTEKYPFPTFNLPAREIYLLDIGTKKIEGFQNKDYDYKDKKYHGKFGLIKL